PFYFTTPPTPALYPLSLHDALPICRYHGSTEFWREETSVLAPEVNLPALRVLLRAVKELDQFETRHTDLVQEKPSQPLSEDQLRSEEHTSELQSRGHLVCRLLLEKK